MNSKLQCNGYGTNYISNTCIFWFDSYRAFVSALEKDNHYRLSDAITNISCGSFTA